jgi:hypothetical protein
MFDERNPRHPEHDDRIPQALNSALGRQGIVSNEYPFRELSRVSAAKIAQELRSVTGLPVTSVELRPSRSLPFLINALRYRGHLIRLERTIADTMPQDALGIKPGTEIGEFVVQGFFGHAGLSTVYKAKDKHGDELALISVPLMSTSVSRLNESVPRGVCSHVPANGVVSSIVCATTMDATLAAQATTLAQISALETARYRDDLSKLSCFYLSEPCKGGRALIFRTGQVYSLRHHLQLQIGYNLSAFSTLAAWCSRVGGHGNLTPESVLLADGDLKSVLNPSVELFDGHFFTSSWEYNPFRLRGTAADVFAIGVMLYENFAGKRPFAAPFVPGVGEAHDFELSSYSAYPRPAEGTMLTPKPLDDIIMRCLRDSSYGIRDLSKDLDWYVNNFGEDTKAIPVRR